MSKIVGRGLLGRAFSEESEEKVLYFCSGVSSSSETQEAEFERERKLLKDTVEGSEFHRIVYFSSVLAPSLANDYFCHKNKMEELVKSLCPDSYLILRLPQVVGTTRNKTFFSEMVRMVRGGERVSVYKEAKRSLIDVDDVVRVTNLLLRLGVENITLDLCSTENVEVAAIIAMIAKEFSVEPCVKYVDIKSDQVCNANLLKGIIGDSDCLFLEGYTNKVVEKYARILQ